MYTRLLLILAGVSLLAGCGGGGSSAGVAATYTGATTQATVTTANAKALSIDAFTGNVLSSAASGIAKESTDSGTPSPVLQEFAAIMEQSVAAMVAPPAAKVVAATAQDTVYGYSGSFSFVINVDQNSGAFSGTCTFSHYQATSTSATLSGPMAFSGTYNLALGTFSSLNISMGNLSGTYGGKSYSLAGTITYSTGGVTISETMSVVLTDNVSSRTYWLKDFNQTFASGIAGNSLVIAGTYYDPIYGYVTVSTITPLTVTSIDATPTAGQLLFTGSTGTKARLTFTSSGYTVEADTAGNGTYVVVP